jgi:hypothetical protein
MNLYHYFVLSCEIVSSHSDVVIEDSKDLLLPSSGPNRQKFLDPENDGVRRFEMGRDSEGSITTRYGLDGPGIEYR